MPGTHAEISRRCLLRSAGVTGWAYLCNNLFHAAIQLRGSSLSPFSSSLRSSAKLPCEFSLMSAQAWLKAGRSRFDLIPSTQLIHVALLIRPFILRKICSLERSMYWYSIGNACSNSSSPRSCPRQAFTGMHRASSRYSRDKSSSKSVLAY